MNKVSFITFASITSVINVWIHFRKSRFSVMCSVKYLKLNEFKLYKTKACTGG